MTLKFKYEWMIMAFSAFIAGVGMRGNARVISVTDDSITFEAGQMETEIILKYHKENYSNIGRNIS